VLVCGSEASLQENKVRIFLDPLRGKFYTKYLARYSKMDVAGGTKTLKSISFMMKLMI
jgi:hypothetical protein